MTGTRRAAELATVDEDIRASTRVLLMAMVIFGCARDDDAEQERTACEAFFVAVDACIDTWSAEKEAWDDVSTCLSECTIQATFCTDWPQSERAAVYAEQLEDDCELFARRWETGCTSAIGDPDDEVLRSTTRAQLFDACVGVYLHAGELPPELLFCAGNGYIEFTYLPDRFCDPLE